MRNRKADELQAKNICLTMPQSLITYAQSHDIKPSAILRQEVAELVLGIPYEQHRALYEGSTLPYKLESPEQSYIRAARWILESAVRQTIVDESAIYVRCYWHLTEVETIVRIDLTSGPGYRRVIYDDILDAMPDVPAVRATGPHFSAANTAYKTAIFSAWVTNSFRPEATNVS